jgi:hypothetical protein
MGASVHYRKADTHGQTNAPGEVQAPDKIEAPSEIEAPAIPPARTTRYMKMCADANEVELRYEIGAWLSAWSTLAGYVVLPNTFTSIGNASDLDKIVGGKIVQKAVQNVAVLKTASVMCCIGIMGNCFLWYRWRGNYVWLSSRIFQEVS